MKEIKDKALLQSYLQQYKIPDLFDTKDLPFQLYEYEAGEIMNYKRPSDKYLKFIVSGELLFYTIIQKSLSRITDFVLNQAKMQTIFSILPFLTKQIHFKL